MKKTKVKKQKTPKKQGCSLFLLLMLLAVVTKVIGCGLGAKIMRYTNKESLQIGIGMISRGEVALIVANKGASVGLMSEKFMTPLVIMSSSEDTTLPLAQLNFQTQFGTNYNLAFASYLLALIPILIFYIFCQKQIIGGIANGAVKG